MRKKASTIRLAAVVADIHCGSTLAILPPGFKTLEGNEVKQTPIQQWLWECWTDATEQWLPEVVGSDPFALVVDGDATEGVHHGTKQIISNELLDHRDAAFQTLKPLVDRAAKTFFVEGTECHTANMEHTLARSLKAEPDPDTGKPAWERLDLTIAGTRCIFQHHIGTAIRPYLEATQLGIQLAVEQLEAVKNGETRMPKLMCCAHRHRYGEFRDASGYSVVVPPWQMLTRHGRKVVPSARTRPGLVIFDWRNREDGDFPEVHVRTYRAPVAQGAFV